MEFVFFIVQVLFGFAFLYPLFMAYLWMFGGIYYYFHWERGEDRSHTEPPWLVEIAPVSIVIPCFNEAQNIEQTVAAALDQDYPDFEIIVVNDGSTDETPEILERLQVEHDKVRVVHLATNQGKAVALNMGALLSPHEFLVTIDGDAMLDRHAVSWMMWHFATGPRVGAVTGNPRIRTRSTLIGKIQVGEFSSIIGLIKRAQRIYGRVFTVSGVVTAFRKAALHRCGYWSNDMVTEDIDVSWKLQLDHWDIRFEPNCLCWILMPETISGLWKQRLRWAQGGVEVLFKYFRDLWQWRKRRMWLVYFELLISVMWAYLITLLAILWLVGFFVEVPAEIQVRTLLPEWTGVILGFTCLLQFAVSMIIDSRYEVAIKRYYYWMIWYPLLYWVINAATTFVAVPMAIKHSGERARWRSPDRGLRPNSG